jgi:hypothetical protein
MWSVCVGVEVALSTNGIYQSKIAMMNSRIDVINLMESEFGSQIKKRVSAVL